MNRELKFRVWDATGKRWMDIFEINLLEGCYLNNPEYPIQQFTGLKDSRGREIYEGDILKDANGMLFEVFWLDTHASFEIAEKQELPDGYPVPKFSHPWVSELNVVGNIYENPELLKTKHD